MKTWFVSLAIMSAALSACTQGTHPSVEFRDEHNARNSLDWAGTYDGVLPCADCEGIKTVVRLSDDGTFRSQVEYLGKGGAPLAEQGQFRWNAQGNTITLGEKDPVQYFVAENRLIQLSPDGARITGALADLYVLTKTDAPQ